MMSNCQNNQKTRRLLTGKLKQARPIAAWSQKRLTALADKVFILATNAGTANMCPFLAFALTTDKCFTGCRPEFAAVETRCIRWLLSFLILAQAQLHVFIENSPNTPVANILHAFIAPFFLDIPPDGCFVNACFFRHLPNFVAFYHHTVDSVSNGFCGVWSFLCLPFVTSSHSTRRATRRVRLASKNVDHCKAIDRPIWMRQRLGQVETSQLTPTCCVSTSPSTTGWRHSDVYATISLMDGRTWVQREDKLSGLWVEYTSTSYV